MAEPLICDLRPPTPASAYTFGWLRCPFDVPRAQFSTLLFLGCAEMPELALKKKAFAVLSACSRRR